MSYATNALLDYHSKFYKLMSVRLMQLFSVINGLLTVDSGKTLVPPRLFLRAL